MATKIGEGPVYIPPRQSGKVGSGVSAPPGQPEKTSSTAEPAVKIDVSNSLLAAQTAGQAAQTEPFDAQLVQEIRDRITSGRFQIDFNEVASNLLREAITSARGSRP